MPNPHFVSLDEAGFAITRGKGFYIRFPNGNTVSVQWGPTNYCDNKDDASVLKSLNSSSSYEELEEKAGRQGCRDAEVAAWDKDGEFYKLTPWDDVIGHQTPRQVISWLFLFAGAERPSQESIGLLYQEMDG
jgi:hypothetical protein